MESKDENITYVGKLLLGFERIYCFGEVVFWRDIFLTTNEESAALSG